MAEVRAAGWHHRVGMPSSDGTLLAQPASTSPWTRRGMARSFALWRAYETFASALTAERRWRTSVARPKRSKRQITQ